MQLLCGGCGRHTPRAAHPASIAKPHTCGAIIAPASAQSLFLVQLAGASASLATSTVPVSRINDASAVASAKPESTVGGDAVMVPPSVVAITLPTEPPQPATTAKMPSQSVRMSFPRHA